VIRDSNYRPERRGKAREPTRLSASAGWDVVPEGRERKKGRGCMQSRVTKEMTEKKEGSAASEQKGFVVGLDVVQGREMKASEQGAKLQCKPSHHQTIRRSNKKKGRKETIELE